MTMRTRSSAAPNPWTVHLGAVAAFLCGVSCLAANQDVYGWNKAGHMVMAAIAYADLKERRPDVVPKVVQILREHPHYASWWADKLNRDSPDDRDLHLFMSAARWADDVRGDHRYDKPKLHFINIPYRPGDEGMEIPRGPNILQALSDSRAIVESITSTEEARAVALCWVFHLTGDIHQPLHTITLVTPQFPEPEGDRGGTRFYVRVVPGGSTISLHKLWDGLIIGSDRLRAVKNRVTELRNRPAFRRDGFAGRLAIQSFDDWAKESYALAVEHAYRKGMLEGSSDERNGRDLPGNYRATVQRIAERQIALSAYRLSDVLVEVLGE